MGRGVERGAWGHSAGHSSAAAAPNRLGEQIRPVTLTPAAAGGPQVRVRILRHRGAPRAERSHQPSCDAIV